MTHDQWFDLVRPKISIAQFSRSTRLRRTLGILAIGWLGFSNACVIHAQVEDHASAVNTVSVSDTPNVRRHWRIRESGLTQQLTGTSGYVLLENISGLSLSSSVFYAEYFDTSNGFCFSLTFSLERNIGDRTPVTPGATRMIFAAASGLVSAVRPTHMQVYLLRDDDSKSEVSEATDHPPVQAPATFSSPYPSSAATLQLPRSVQSQIEPFADLLLARVAVNKQGQITDTQILNAADPSVTAWFADIVPGFSFYPATISNLPVDSVALIDVIAIRSKNYASTPLPPAYDRPWIQQYIGQSSKEIPLVTQVVFTPPGRTMQLAGSSLSVPPTPAEPGTLELGIFGSEWSLPNYEWIREEYLPLHQARRLIENTHP